MVQLIRFEKEIIFFFALVLLFVGMIFLHEMTHKQIFKSYGCENIRYGFDGMSAFTFADCPNDDSLLANNINEVVGYNIMPFFVILILFLFSNELYRDMEELKNDK